MLARFSAHFSVVIQSHRLTWCCSRRLSFCASSTRGAFAPIDDWLAKSSDFAPEDFFFLPDTFSHDKLDHSYPQPVMSPTYQYRQFGLPFELSISGFLANVSLAESAGVRLPGSEKSWTWDDWTEWDARMTDPETGTFGTWARDDYAGQYLPQMYTNGLKKPFDDGLTKTMFDQPEALEAWSYLIDKVFERKTSPTVREAGALAGEHGNPFAAGKIGIWPTDKVGSTGVEAAQIKDRFTWTLLPEVIAPGGGPPGHSWSMRANLVTVGAWHEGSVEQAVHLVLYLAGEDYQGRVGVERGHVPVHRSAIEEPDAIAPPPGGMKWLKVYADRTDNRSRTRSRAGRRGGGITRGWRGRGGLGRSRLRRRWRRARHGASGTSRSTTDRSSVCA